VQGCKRTPKRFDLVKIRAKSQKIWANSLKIQAKLCPTWFDLRQWRSTFAELHEDLVWG